MESLTKTSKILIVDDTPSNIQLVAQILSKHGYNIIIANNGIQALKVTEKIIPDLILLDIMMPEMDGLETCRHLKESKRTSDIPVIFFTAKSETNDIIKGFEVGAVDYITKPFNSAELVTRVKTHIDLKDKSDILIEKNQNIKELVHILTHDLSNPISGINMLLTLIKENPSLLNSVIDKLQLSIINCLNIIDNVRQMSSIEDNKLQYKFESINLKSNIELSINIFEYKLIDKKLKLEINVPKELTIYVDGVSFINSIFSNIMSNAIKFSNPESTISINAEKIDNQVILQIQDHGIGIPEKLLNDIFNISKPTSRKGTNGEIGTGYGMPLVKKFIEKFNGKIEIKSIELPHENHGTTIIIYLPINKTE